VRRRFASLLSAGDGRWTLINAAADRSQQMRATCALQPHDGLRESPIDATCARGEHLCAVALDDVGDVISAQGRRGWLRLVRKKKPRLDQRGLGE
jgi:hypothetical protein